MKKNTLMEIKDKGVLYEESDAMRNIVYENVTKHQLDALLILIALSCKEGIPLSQIQIPTMDFVRLMNPSNPRKKDVQEKIIEEIRSLSNCKLWIYTDKSAELLNMVEKLIWNKEGDSVTVLISSSFTKYFTNIPGQGTVYALKDVLELSTIFQARLYSWAMANSGFTNSIYINIEAAKTIFNSNVEIKTKRFIEKLESAIEAINNKTSLKIEVKKIIKSKFITGLEFNITNTYRPEITEKKAYPSDKRKSANLFCKYLNEKKEKENAENIIKAVKKAVM